MPSSNIYLHTGSNDKILTFGVIIPVSWAYYKELRYSICPTSALLNIFNDKGIDSDEEFEVYYNRYTNKLVIDMFVYPNYTKNDCIDRALEMFGTIMSL